MSVEGKIALSIIVRIVGGRAFLARCIGQLLPQVEGRPIEVIVPHDSTSGDAARSLRDMHQVIPVDMGVVQTDSSSDAHAQAHELYDRRTAVGLTVARGEVLALLEDTVVPRPDWCEQVLEAHRLPHGAIGGAVEHGGRGILNWAVYFCDFGRYQLPLAEGPADYLTDVNVSYKREALESLREVWEERYNEVTVNWALSRRGAVLWQRPQIVVHQDRGELSFAELMAERYSWGKLFGHLRARESSFVLRLVYALLSPGIPVLLLGRRAWKVISGRRNWLQFLLSLPLIVVMTVVWCAGEFVGYVAGPESSG
jgi:hypothetical protein